MELVFGVLAAIVTVVVSAGALLGEWFKLSAHMDAARQLADKLGLDRVGKDGFAGTFEGVQIQQSSVNRGSAANVNWWTTTRCTLLEDPPAGLSVETVTGLGKVADLVRPADIQIGNELDPKLRIGGDHPDDVRELLTDPDVLVRLRAVVHSNATVTVRGRQLMVSEPGRHLEDSGRRIRRATDLVHALRDARRRQWQVLCERFDLQQGDRQLELTGRLAGANLAIRHEDGVTEIRVAPDLGLPERTRVTHADQSAGSERLGDPILDEMLAVSTSDPRALAERLSGDAVRGPLLEVLHGNPGSELTDAGLTAVVVGWPGSRLVQAVGAVVELVEALADR